MDDEYDLNELRASSVDVPVPWADPDWCATTKRMVDAGYLRCAKKWGWPMDWFREKIADGVILHMAERGMKSKPRFARRCKTPGEGEPDPAKIAYPKRKRKSVSRRVVVQGSEGVEPSADGRVEVQGGSV